jgi:hypothetical protein
VVAVRPLRKQGSHPLAHGRKLSGSPPEPVAGHSTRATSSLQQQSSVPSPEVLLHGIESKRTVVILEGRAFLYSARVQNSVIGRHARVDIVMIFRLYFYINPPCCERRHSQATECRCCLSVFWAWLRGAKQSKPNNRDSLKSFNSAAINQGLR